MKKLYFSMALFGLAVVVYLAFFCRFLDNTSFDLEKEEQAVYSAALVDFGVRTALIRAETYYVKPGSNFPDTNWSEIRTKLPVSKGTFDDYLARNRRPYFLTRAMKLDVKYYIIRDDELTKFRGISRENLEGTGGLLYEMRRRYPGVEGLFQFSRVGFNGDRSEALVYVVFECGDLCAEGYYLRLEKRNGIWQADDKWLLWMA